MAVHDLRAQRLFVEASLETGARVLCTPGQVNYLLNVLRLAEGATILAFNGRDGEWQTRIASVTKRGCWLIVAAQTRPQEHGPDVDYLFAPLKRARLDYMVQKAAEMGVRRLRPVLTRHTIAERVNLERMRANAIEAAEQCGVLYVPSVEEPVKLAKVLTDWDPSRTLIFCDEAAESSNPVRALQKIEPGPVALLIGPEGGFALEERDAIGRTPFVVTLSLGPRIMRADTAAIAALALINATLGDWR